VANYIAVTGPIGVGKTSLASALAEAMDARLLLEQAEKNAYLPTYYESAERVALRLQTALLLERSRRLAALARSERLTIADFLFEKELVFSRVALREFEMDIYRELYERSAQLVPPPRKVVYLTGEPEFLLERIKKRARPFEMSISADYLKRVVDGYEEMLSRYDKAPVLRLPGIQVDLDSSSRFMKELVAGLREDL